MSSAILCPTCGAARMRRVRRSVESRVDERCVVVPDVSLDECPRCGERLFDLAALAEIRRARQRAVPACSA